MIKRQLGGMLNQYIQYKGNDYATEELRPPEAVAGFDVRRGSQPGMNAE